MIIIVSIFLFLLLIVVMAIENIKQWREIISILKSCDLRQGKINRLKYVDRTWISKVGSAKRYILTVELEENEKKIEVPTLHCWNLTRCGEKYNKNKFVTKEKGRVVDIYFNCERNCAIIKDKKLSILLNAAISSLGVVGCIAIEGLLIMCL